MVQLVSDLVSQPPEFPSFKKMLDLGGGPGIFCMAMVSKHPEMTGVVFGRQPVVETASAYIREAGMEKRVSVLAGDRLPQRVEPMTRIELVNLFLTKEALYRLSYMGVTHGGGGRI